MQTFTSTKDQSQEQKFYTCSNEPTRNTLASASLLSLLMTFANGANEVKWYEDVYSHMDFNAAILKTGEA